jgi:ParB family chromosome partitioning protein
MKGKRKIFDAVDLLTEDSSAQFPEGGVRTLPLDSIRAFHDHPFRMYEGERLKDMVESIREHGVLSPVIVQETQDGYEMLSGHTDRMRRVWPVWRRFRRL